MKIFDEFSFKKFQRLARTIAEGQLSRKSTNKAISRSLGIYAIESPGD